MRVPVPLQKFFLLALLLLFAAAARADVAVPPLTGRVVDLTGTLSSGDIAALTQKLKALEDNKGSQIAVLMVPTTQPETIEQFSMRVAEQWKIGRKKVDDGAILLIAKNDRRLRIEVGYGLEGALTDVTSKRIIDEIITPRFKSGDYTGGISAGVDRMIGVINGEPLPPPNRAASNHANEGSNFPALLMVAFIICLFFRSVFGRIVGALAAAGAVAFVVWLFIGSLAITLIAAVVAFIFTLISGASLPAGSTSGGSSGSGWGGGS
ncbi:MAG: YgcG family protein, partial [Burkholderiales bacterium]|nr:YgcG family protein [Burkholderiales bacterium]